MNRVDRGNPNARFDLARLPATWVNTGARGAGIFLIVFALAWGGIPTVVLILSLVHGQFRPELPMTLIFTAIGTGMLMLGLKLATGHEETTIAADRVTVRKRSLFGRSEWSAPLQEYAGVLSRTEHHSGGKNRSSYTLHIVDLHHTDRQRVVRLYESRSGEGLRGAWESASRALGLPALI
ncbi:MAG: hypothetical protein K8T26_12650 [Lentisphaerae bacterium]|nr:hypothetical protein [Lentisphaerota bacterium]